jgi:hypothetical protein
MAEYDVTIVWKIGANVKNGPSVGGAVLHVFPQGAKFKASAIVADRNDPDNPDKQWAKILGGKWGGKYVAVRYPSAGGNPVRATWVEIGNSAGSQPEEDGPRPVRVVDIPTVKIKLAYIKHQPERSGFNIRFYPDTCIMQDEGRGKLKGRTIPIHENWWRYIEKINDERGYKYARSIGAMWINIGYDIDTPYSMAKAESIHCGGNFIEWDLETRTHVRVVSYPNDFDASILDPLVDNWMNKPHRFWKVVTINLDGKLLNPTVRGAGADVYIPIICNVRQFGKEPGLWIEKDKLQIFAEDFYTFNNGDVYLNGNLFFPTGTLPPAI